MRAHIPCFLIFLLMFPASGHADEPLPLPRFVTIKSGKANMRVGPGENYPVIWVYKRAGLPVEIIEEHQNWRRVRDPEGDEGWMLKNLLSGARSAIITASRAPLRRKPESLSPPSCYAASGVVLKLQECRAEWCLASHGNRRGWVEKSALWGVYPHEYFED